MGKFIILLEKEKSRKIHPCIEAALYAAQFTRGRNPCIWARWVPVGERKAAYAELNPHTGVLSVCEKESGRGTYGVPDGVLAGDDAQALMQWLDGVLEPWL